MGFLLRKGPLTAITSTLRRPGQPRPGHPDDPAPGPRGPPLNERRTPRVGPLRRPRARTPVRTVPATGRAAPTAKGLHGIALDGRGPVLDELGSSPYPYREIEYAYAWGDPPTDSLTASFLAHLARGRGQDVVRARGHLPCATPKGLRIRGEG
ncbi:hypothetical protein ACFWF9_17325 [Streptomyces roseolus]|uniref:hypothetical protein n=1 Tax=Streptomyces roseolus TaxID=67358 RepID=UPI0036660491